jgi:molybdopterin molybdotransferase
MSDLISVAEAHARLMQLFAPVDVEQVPLAEAFGRVLAQDVVAERDQPPFAASAMDGYAVRAADLAPGARLAIVGMSVAGARFGGDVGPGEAVRIFTGAPMPAGADSVLIQEDAEPAGNAIIVRAGVAPDVHVRPAGSDFHRGMRVAAPRRLGPSDIALLAAMNAGTLTVARRPVVALIPTGDELVVPGEPIGPDQIASSNGLGLKALVEAAGGEARLLPIALDTAESLAAVLGLAKGADLIVTIGGVSVGDFDLVQKTAIAHGLELEFYRVAMRPGKPLMAGRFGGVPMVGLPGNPVSAMVCGLVFLRPAIARLLGLPSGLPERMSARLGSALEPNGPREHYMRALVEADGTGWRCSPLPRQDSSLLSVLAEANALLIREPHAPAGSEGEAVAFTWL